MKLTDTAQQFTGPGSWYPAPSPQPPGCFVFGVGGVWVGDKIASGCNPDTSFHVLAKRTLVPASVVMGQKSQVGFRADGPGTGNRRMGEERSGRLNGV